MKLFEIAAMIRGKPYGRSDRAIRHILPPDEAQGPDLTFLFDQRTKTHSSMVISSRPVKDKSGIVVPDPRRAMFELLRRLSARVRLPSVSKLSVVDPSVRIPRSCTIEPYAVIGENVRIGRGTYLGAHCVIGAHAVIGDHCDIHAAAVICGSVLIGDHVIINAHSVIGKQGFGYYRSKGNRSRYRRMEHIGKVVINDFVEIGSGVTIDRGTIGATVIGRGTKIDNLVHIAHNVKIGQNCMIMGQCGIAGSSSLGDNVVLCGQTGVSDHVTIGSNAVVLAKSAVFKSIPGQKRYSGIPAREHTAVLRALARLYDQGT
ncbi:MAG TPA: UDP-3-O-(3-hydroxymyristoyl)glucosamine N-acyltransferase [bacterium]